MRAIFPFMLRFIPVGTGNANSQIEMVDLIAVYPRGYGERRKKYRQSQQLCGLSPWVRGTPH